MKRIYFFIGTTAELIKLAPVIKELEESKINFKIVASNQNRLHFKELKHIIKKSKADYTFKIKSFSWPKNIYLRFIVWIFKSFGNFYLYFKNEFKSDKNNVLFIVHGDTITSAIGAIVAKLCRVKLLHIESGLRSYNFLEPFPEEINRFIISYLADIHFCPNSWAVNNLKWTRGVKINIQYNTVLETLGHTLKIKSRDDYKILLGNKKYFVLVVHRQEHTLFNKSITKELLKIFSDHANKNLRCVLILHMLTKNFLIEGELMGILKKNKNIIMLPRLSYVEFVNLLDGSEFIATDGGSNQEEAYYLGKPCLLLRKRTERIEGLGKNAVLTKNSKKAINNFLRNYKKHERKKVDIKTSPSKIVTKHLIKDY